MREVIAAIREGLPDADQMQPDQVFQHVLGGVTGGSGKTNRTVRRMIEKRTVLFAQAKFVNDLKGRFYNCVARITRIPILRFLGAP
jgi:hypothetical protein